MRRDTAGLNACLVYCNTVPLFGKIWPCLLQRTDLRTVVFFMTSCAAWPVYLNLAISSDREGAQTSLRGRSELNCIDDGIDPLLVQLLYKVYFKLIQIVLLFLLQTRD